MATPPVVFGNARLLATKVANAKAGDCPYALFLGAGASVSSGIPTVKAMVDRWKRDLFCCLDEKPDLLDEEEYKKWLTVKYPAWREQHSDAAEGEYGTLFGYFHQSAPERQIHIECLMEDKKPTLGYLYLAGLIRARFFNRILTTNFDDLLADALVRYYDLRPMVCAFDSAVAGIRVASQRPKIIKLHGDFLFTNLRNVRDELMRLEDNMEEKLFEMCKDSGLIVVGYEGADQSIIDPIHHMLRQGRHLKMGLHWCVHKPSGSVIPPKVQEMRNHYRNQIHLYEIESFDHLTMEMFLACACKLPEVLLEPQKKSAFRELEAAYKSFNTKLMHPTMREHMYLFMDAARKQIYSRDLEVILADHLHTQGSDEAKRKNWKKARDLFGQGRLLIDDVLGDKAISFDIQIRALKRKTGLCVGLLEVEQEERSPAWRDVLKRTLEAVAEGIALAESEKADDTPIAIKRTFQYNGLCGYSLKARMEKLSAEESSHVARLYAELKLMDPEGEDIADLTKETGYQDLKPFLSLEPSFTLANEAEKSLGDEGSQAEPGSKKKKAKSQK
jgi:NAD-dependent SIR2 family protein deacetylase